MQPMFWRRMLEPRRRRDPPPSYVFRFSSGSAAVRVDRRIHPSHATLVVRAAIIARLQAFERDEETYDTSRADIELRPAPIGIPCGMTPTGKPLYMGPRGGRYHISKNDVRVYHQTKR